MCYVIKDIHDRWEFPIYGIAIRQRVCMYVCMYVCIEITGLYFAAVWSVRQRGCRAPPPKLCMTVSNIYALRNLSIQTNVCIGNVYVDQLLLRHGARFSLVDHGCGVEMAALNTESAYKTHTPLLRLISYVIEPMKVSTDEQGEPLSPALRGFRGGTPL